VDEVRGLVTVMKRTRVSGDSECSYQVFMCGCGVMDTK